MDDSEGAPTVAGYRRKVAAMRREYVANSARLEGILAEQRADLEAAENRLADIERDFPDAE